MITESLTTSFGIFSISISLIIYLNVFKTFKNNLLGGLLNPQNILGRLVHVRWYGNGDGGSRPNNGNRTKNGGLGGGVDDRPNGGLGGGVDDRPDGGVLTGGGSHETGEEQDLHDAGLRDIGAQRMLGSRGALNAL